MTTTHPAAVDDPGVDFDTAGSDDSEFRFVGIADPAAVVGAVDWAQREAAVAP